MISCPEEIAYRMGFIDKTQLAFLGKQLQGNQYGEYLQKLAFES
jgi:glucose-1-phosphate thymidylyltransferase